MKNIENATRTSFFTNSSKKADQKSGILAKSLISENNSNRKKEIDNATKRDANVKISDAIKDFSKIKKSVDNATPIDNSEKIAKIKQSIADGTYKMNYEAIADKILSSEM